ncbi:hypothetical protein T492DRAFT_833696 [Pavlovales sp. CCMP2436]|nr:hypothetical protein T492DRAFT_833696 [Pavlovales sp. CCMP2436]
MMPFAGVSSNLLHQKGNDLPSPSSLRRDLVGKPVTVAEIVVQSASEVMSGVMCPFSEPMTVVMMGPVSEVVTVSCRSRSLEHDIANAVDTAGKAATLAAPWVSLRQGEPAQTPLSSRRAMDEALPDHWLPGRADLGWFKFGTRTEVQPASPFDGTADRFNYAANDAETEPGVPLPLRPSPVVAPPAGNDGAWPIIAHHHFDDLARPDRDQVFAAAQARLATTTTFASGVAATKEVFHQGSDEQEDPLDPGPEERRRRAPGKRSAWQDELARRNHSYQNDCWRSVEQLLVYRR